MSNTVTVGVLMNVHELVAEIISEISGDALASKPPEELAEDINASINNRVISEVGGSDV